MDHSTNTLLEWGAALLSLYAFWLCIKRRAVCFFIFIVADLFWLYSAWEKEYVTLIIQQVIYLVMNVVGYKMWKEEELQETHLEKIESRPLVLEENQPIEEVISYD